MLWDVFYASILECKDCLLCDVTAQIDGRRTARWSGLVWCQFQSEGWLHPTLYFGSCELTSRLAIEEYK